MTPEQNMNESKGLIESRAVTVKDYSAMTPEQKKEELRNLIENNAVTVNDYSKEEWPSWLLETENCIDALLDGLDADRQHKNITKARQIIADYAIKRKGKKSMQMPEGPLRSFVEFAGRDDLKGDYHFANRAQRRHASERSNAALARLEAECRFLQCRVVATIKAELAGDDAASRLRAVSDQATDFFTECYRSIYDAALKAEGDAAKVAYDDAVRMLEAGASGACRQRATSAPALLADALAVAP